MAILRFILHTGLRRGEIVALTWSDVDQVSGQVTVRGKGGRERVVPLAARTVGSGREREQAILQAEVEVTRAQAAITAYQADRAAAMQPRTYSPTYHYAPHYQREALPAPPPTDLPTSTPSVGGHPPTFADLLARGQVGKGNVRVGENSETAWQAATCTGCGPIRPAISRD